jgi:hypothetical protein
MAQATEQQKREFIRYRLDLAFFDAIKRWQAIYCASRWSHARGQYSRCVRDGQTLRLNGKGRPAAGEGLPGDALIDISVLPHP